MATFAFFGPRGCGATSLVRDIGFALARMDFKVLLIDAHPQANLTEWLGVKSTEVNNSQTLLDVFQPGSATDTTPQLPTPIRRFKMSFIPANSSLVNAEKPLSLAAHRAGGRPRALPGDAFEQHKRLSKAIARLDELYDKFHFVLIDAPYLSELGNAAAMAADRVVVPVAPDKKGRDGLITVNWLLEAIKRHNAGVRIGLVIPNGADSTRLGKANLNYFHTKVAEFVPVSHDVPFRPALYNDLQEAGMPLGFHSPDSTEARIVDRVACGLLAAGWR